LRRSSRLSLKGLPSIRRGSKQTLIQLSLSQLVNQYRANPLLSNQRIPEVAIVRGAFNSLLKPGLAKALGYSGKTFRAQFTEDDPAQLMYEIERAEQMAVVHPDTSKIPIWRRPPTKVEHPITAWRAWGLQKDEGKWKLSSVAVDFLWEGPVMRAHKRPVDPSYWDAKKALRVKGDGVSLAEYYDELHDTFSLAGIYAVKTLKQAIETAHEYDVSCYGKIKLWGRIAQYELGYRAEVAMIEELWVMKNVRILFNTRNAESDNERIEAALRQVTRDLQQRYGCEVHQGV
jgi:hypothetical protein